MEPMAQEFASGSSFSTDTGLPVSLQLSYHFHQNLIFESVIFRAGCRYVQAAVTSSQYLNWLAEAPIHYTEMAKRENSSCICVTVQRASF